MEAITAVAQNLARKIGEQRDQQNGIYAVETLLHLVGEDTDRDGKADACKVFYDKLHCPTGFEFWNGGVLVVDQPRLLWLKDTDGDDKADEVVHLVDGWATDDTHHTCGAFEWNHAGALHMLEGIATSTTLETPWGPHRSQGTGGAYVMDPRTLKIRQFALPGQYNMWCYVFDEWGQGIVGDGTTPNQTWDTPLSGAQFTGRKGLNFILPGGVRPAHRYAYIPFGAGHRYCIGATYAHDEAEMILDELGRRFTFRSEHVADARPEHKFVLRAPDPLSVTVHHR